MSALLFLCIPTTRRMSVQNLITFGAFLSPPAAELYAYRSRRSPTTPFPHIDPFADEGDPLGSTQDVGSQANYIHIRIQQRNGRKTLTTLQGLPKGSSRLTFSHATHVC